MAEKLYVLFLRVEWNVSFRRTAKLYRGQGIRCPSKSTAVRAQQNSLAVYQKHTESDHTRQTNRAAIDGSTLSQRKLNEYYVLRAGIKRKERPETKISIFIDTRSKKILSARFRKKVRHDLKDVRYLLRASPIKPAKLVADKGYDAEWFRKFLAEQGIGCCIPIKEKAVHGYYGKRSRCDKRTYRRRSMVENSFFRLKQLYGRNVNCAKARTMRAEVFLRFILYNISLWLWLI